MAAPAEDPTADVIAYLRFVVPAELLKPEIAIICGSGLNGLTTAFEKGSVVVQYADIPHFPVSGVQGHTSTLVFGILEGKSVVAMTGRFHFYEGNSAALVPIGVRVFAALGAKVLLVTNAAGAANNTYKKLDIMVMRDHISFPGLAGHHPSIGANDLRFGERFFAVTPAYNEALQKLALTAAEELPELGLPAKIRHGVYVNVSGPTYETKAEIGFLRTIGGDSVGMSTAFEVIEAAHSGMQVLGLSFITNVCAGPTDVGIPAASHGEVLDSAKEGKTEFQALVTRIVRKMETKDFPVPRPAAHFEGVKAKAPVAAVAPTPAAAEPLVATLAKSEAAPVPAATAAAAAPRPAVDVKAVVVLAAVTGAVAGVAATILARCFVHYRRSL